MIAKRKILVIDDAPTIRIFLRISLEAQGAIFYEASTAADGLALAAREKPDLLVLDLGLPDRDGLEVLTEVKQGAKPPTIIVLTVRKEQAVRDRALQLGARTFLTKPFVMEELSEAIGEALN